MWLKEPRRYSLWWRWGTKSSLNSNPITLIVIVSPYSLSPRWWRRWRWALKRVWLKELRRSYLCWVLDHKVMVPWNPSIWFRNPLSLLIVSTLIAAVKMGLWRECDWKKRAYPLYVDVWTRKPRSPGMPSSGSSTSHLTPCVPCESGSIDGSVEREWLTEPRRSSLCRRLDTKSSVPWNPSICIVTYSLHSLCALWQRP